MEASERVCDSRTRNITTESIMISFDLAVLTKQDCRVIGRNWNLFQFKILKSNSLHFEKAKPGNLLKFSENIRDFVQISMALRMKRRSNFKIPCSLQSCLFIKLQSNSVTKQFKFLCKNLDLNRIETWNWTILLEKIVVQNQDSLNLSSVQIQIVNSIQNLLSFSQTQQSFSEDFKSWA